MDVCLDNYIDFETIDEDSTIVNHNSDKTYKIIEKIGEGKLGKIFDCETKIGRRVALKIIDKNDLLDSDFNLNCIQNEINIHLQLKNNNVLLMEDCFQDNSFIYMILELGTCSLHNIIYESNYEIKRIFKILSEILNGLIYLKENLIIHRDIKSENIILNKRVIKIADFGHSCKLEYSDQLLNEQYGTPEYMSPQIVQSLDYSFETDIWSLGIVFYELLFKNVPFDAESDREIFKVVKDSEVIYPMKLPNIIKNIIDSMLIKDRLLRITHENLLLKIPPI